MQDRWMEYSDKYLNFCTGLAEEILMEFKTQENWLSCQPCMSTFQVKRFSHKVVRRYLLSVKFRRSSSVESSRGQLLRTTVGTLTKCRYMSWTPRTRSGQQILSPSIRLRVRPKFTTMRSSQLSTLKEAIK